MNGTTYNLMVKITKDLEEAEKKLDELAYTSLFEDLAYANGKVDALRELLESMV